MNVYTAKKAKQNYRSTRKQLEEGFRMPPFKKWFREKRKTFAEGVKLSPKLERIVLKV